MDEAVEKERGPFPPIWRTLTLQFNLDSVPPEILLKKYEKIIKLLSDYHVLVDAQRTDLANKIEKVILSMEPK